MMTQTDVARIRQAFANRIAALAQIKSSALVEALANVPPKPAEMEAILSFNRGAGEPAHP